MRRFLALAVLALALPTQSLPAQVQITEFMANNTATLKDDFGQYEDWIEIHNAGASSVNLLDWALTDSATNFFKWRFPATNLPPQGYLLVFASNRDRRTPGLPLHTNFKLDAAGEYLALVCPDGSIATEFAPQFPPQVADVSFGFSAAASSQVLLSSNSVGRVLVPQDDQLGLTWTQPDFADQSWTVATNGIGFETGAGEFGGLTEAVQAEDPVGYWRLNESPGSSTAVNFGSLGAVANGTYLAGATPGAASGFCPPVFPGLEPGNTGAHFDGAGAKIDVPYAPQLNPGVFTVECWARVSGGQGNYRSPLTSRDDFPQRGYIFYATPSDEWEFWLGTTASWQTLRGPALTLNQWTHLVGTYDGAVMAFYVNGVLVGTNSVTLLPNTAKPLRIGGGATEGEGNYFFVGEVDEVAVYERVLTATEIAQHYQTALQGGSSTTPHYYYTDLIKTDLQASMLNRNASAYYRIPFALTNATSVEGLVLRVKYDDGFVAWLNGQPVASRNAPLSLAWNSAAAALSSPTDALAFEVFDLSSYRGALVDGTNVLALQALNYGATNGDLLLLPELETAFGAVYSTTPCYFLAPAPGRPNSIGSAAPGPLISQAAQSPALPTTNDDLVVTCHVASLLAPVASVQLNWRVMFGPIMQAPMFDDGLHGDGAAGDGVFGAIITNRVGTNWTYTRGQMVRWFITAADTAGALSRWPLFNDPLNSPEYLGTMIADPAATTNLPVFYWFASDPNAGWTRAGTRGAAFFNGELYDNIFIRLRGGADTQGQKFDFNTGYHCRMNDEVGRVEEVNLNGPGADASYLRPPLAFETIRLVGNAASQCFPMAVWVNGGFARIADYAEQVDDSFLARWGFDPAGALYKFGQRSQLTPVFSDATDGVLKKLGTPGDFSDIQAFVRGLNQADSAARRAWFFDALNVPQFINYLAARALMQECDDVRKNFYLHRDTYGSGEWSIFPWDKDFTFGVLADGMPNLPHPFFGDQAHGKVNPAQWNVLLDYVFNDPVTRAMYLRRLRTVLDQQLQAQGTPNNPLALRATTWMQPLAREMGTGFSNQLVGVLAYFPQRRTDLYVTYAQTNTASGQNALVPPSQPTNATVTITGLDYNPASGNQDEEYICLTNANSYAVDLSGWQLGGGISYTFKPGTVLPPTNTLYVSPNVSAFRGRASPPHGGMGLFVQGKYKGQLNAWGESLTLTDSTGRLVSTNTYIGNPSLAQRYLRITEIMYNPAPLPGSTTDSQQFEYIELRNISTNLTLDLAGVRFTSGIAFSFSGSSVTNLAPGQSVVLVRNLASFSARYGTAFAIAGQYSGVLDNAGEDLRLEDAVGEKILEFKYDPAWYPLTDGQGYSLVIVNENAPWATWGLQTSWRPSSLADGSPGLPDPPPPPVILAIEPTGSQVKVSVGAWPGATCVLEYKDTLTALFWLPASPALPCIGGFSVLADTNSPPVQRFYRVRAQ